MLQEKEVTVLLETLMQLLVKPLLTVVIGL